MVLTDGVIAISALLGVGTVPITSALKGEHWPVQIKFALAVALSAVVAVVQTVVTGNVHSLAQFFAMWATAVASGQAFYTTYFSSTTFEDQLKKVGHIAGRTETVIQEVTPAVNIAIESNPKLAAEAKTAENIASSVVVKDGPVQ